MNCTLVDQYRSKTSDETSNLHRGGAALCKKLWNKNITANENFQVVALKKDKKFF